MLVSGVQQSDSVICTQVWSVIFYTLYQSLPLCVSVCVWIFSLLFYPCLTDIFPNYIVRLMCFNDCYIFSMYYIFYQYQISFFVLFNAFHLEFYFFWCCYYYTYFLGKHCLVFFFCFFIFVLFRSFYFTPPIINRLRLDFLKPRLEYLLKEDFNF